jgi:hypothetical protein
MPVQDILDIFKKDIFAFHADKFLHDISIDDKFTQDMLDTLNNDILPVTLYSIPVDDIFVHDIFVVHAFVLFTSFVMYPPLGTNVPPYNSV